MSADVPLQSISPPIIVAIPTAVIPLEGAEEIATLGIELYPPPLFVKVIYLTPPFTIPVIAEAVTPAPIKFKV